MGKSIQAIKEVRPEVNVYEAAQQRIAAIFDQFDQVSVGFSGGKDSTVVLHLALAEAQRRQQVLHVFFSDEEAVDPDTEAYVTAVAAWPGVAFQWQCAPVRHTFASQQRAFWTCWDVSAQDVWIRQPPAGSRVGSEAWLPGMSLDKLTTVTVRQTAPGSWCHLVGVRAQESLNRFGCILKAQGFVTRCPGYAYAKPIYDWTTHDVWTVIRTEGWPYSAYYDKMRRLGIARHQQRIAPLDNVASVDRMFIWAQLYPVFWEQVLRRLPEIAVMARYGRTRLFHKGQQKPLGLTWQQWTLHLLGQIGDTALTQRYRRALECALLRWEQRYSVPFPEETLRDPVTGQPFGGANSWKRWAMILAKHDQIAGAMRDIL